MLKPGFIYLSNEQSEVTLRSKVSSEPDFTGKRVFDPYKGNKEA